ncbi:hypothetical protein KFL_015220020 [Klebsormidium nitens]|uniref:Uncharacterized protein n=1 Tax=Klebsormidium nitens TaxID=105231 RepID=A0A1Y1IUY7_KLENI|nr:hypothetical protein KFL_015220020 [Klebsormidium nitens]|eukprot:GAQ93429.1 hypothetical protein KFL_015220020 [Klebsormidium nitens]
MAAEAFLKLDQNAHRLIFDKAGVSIATVKEVCKDWLLVGRRICRKLTLTGNEVIPRDGTAGVLSCLQDVKTLVIEKGFFRRGSKLRQSTLKSIVAGVSYRHVQITSPPLKTCPGLVATLHKHLKMDRLKSFCLSAPRIPKVLLAFLISQGRSLPMLSYLSVEVSGEVDWAGLKGLKELQQLYVAIKGSHPSEGGLFETLEDMKGVTVVDVKKLGSDWGEDRNASTVVSAQTLALAFAGRDMLEVDIMTGSAGVGTVVTDGLLAAMSGTIRHLVIDIANLHMAADAGSPHPITGCTGYDLDKALRSRRVYSISLRLGRECGPLDECVCPSDLLEVLVRESGARFVLSDALVTAYVGMKEEDFRARLGDNPNALRIEAMKKADMLRSACQVAKVSLLWLPRSGSRNSNRDLVRAFGGHWIDPSSI